MATVFGGGSLASGSHTMGGAGARVVSASSSMMAEPAEVYVVSWDPEESSDSVWKDLEGGHWVAKS